MVPERLETRVWMLIVLSILPVRIEGSALLRKATARTSPPCGIICEGAQGQPPEAQCGLSALTTRKGRCLKCWELEEMVVFEAGKLDSVLIKSFPSEKLHRKTEEFEGHSF